MGMNKNLRRQIKWLINNEISFDVPIFWYDDRIHKLRVKKLHKDIERMGLFTPPFDEHKIVKEWKNSSGFSCGYIDDGWHTGYGMSYLYQSKSKIWYSVEEEKWHLGGLIAKREYLQKEIEGIKLILDFFEEDA
jgi:hypothetical protein